MSLNSVTLVGRLTADPETRSVGENTVTSFRMAITRVGRDDANYITVTCWNSLATAVGTYLRTGRLVGVAGELRSEEWTKDGERRNRTVVVAHNVDFLDRPPATRNERRPNREEADHTPHSEPQMEGSGANVAT